MKFRNLAIACLVVLFVVYCGTAVLAPVCTSVSITEGELSSVPLFLKNSSVKPGPIALGDPIIDPRPH